MNPFRSDPRLRRLLTQADETARLLASMQEQGMPALDVEDDLDEVYRELGKLMHELAGAPEEDEEPDEFDDLEDFDLPEDDPPDDIVPLGDFEDDEPFEFDAPPPKPEPAATPASPGRITLEVAGKEPLSDNYPLSVVAVDRDSVVVELPVLVARSRVGVDKGFLVYGEVFVGATRVAEVRQMVEPASLAEFGPTFVFLKVLAPVVESQGEIKVVVQKADLDGTGRSELFTRVTPYRL